MGIIFIAEKVWTVRKSDWKAKLLASTLVVELFYDTFLGIIFVKGTIDMAFRRKSHWGNEEKIKRTNTLKHRVSKYFLTRHPAAKHKAKRKHLPTRHPAAKHKAIK
jgi:hypothetical protein